MENFIRRLLLIPVTIFFLLLNLQIIGHWLGGVIYDLTGTVFGKENDWKIDLLYWGFIGFPLLWAVTQLCLEIINYANSSRITGYWLEHLRYAPIASFIFGLIITFAFDFGMIQYSRFELRSYIYSDSQTVENPVMVLHHDSRSFCGNAQTARYSSLYFDVASAGLHDKDPYVRSRSLLATYRVTDRLNGGSIIIEDLLSGACRDESPIVRQTAEIILESRHSSCRKF